MCHNLFRIMLLSIAIVMILAACGTPAPATKVLIVTESPIATEIAPTNTLEPIATQIVPGAVEGLIAFQSNRDGNKEIYVMNGDGNGLTNLTNSPANEDGRLAWSPDGTQIIFMSNRDGNNELYVINADGSGVTRLTDNTADDEVPDWSP